MAISVKHNTFVDVQIIHPRPDGNGDRHTLSMKFHSLEHYELWRPWIETADKTLSEPSNFTIKGQK